jgi:hypothetical protein
VLPTATSVLASIAQGAIAASSVGFIIALPLLGVASWKSRVRSLKNSPAVFTDIFKAAGPGLVSGDAMALATVGGEGSGVLRAALRTTSLRDSGISMSASTFESESAIEVDGDTNLLEHDRVDGDEINNRVSGISMVEGPEPDAAATGGTSNEAVPFLMKSLVNARELALKFDPVSKAAAYICM